MAHQPSAHRPISLVVATVGAAVTGAAVVAIGIASLLANHAMFSTGIGLALVAYGLVVCSGAWLAHRRHFLARGMIVAPGLLHVATAVNLLQGGDTFQSVAAGVALAVSATTVVAAVLPSTRRALSPDVQLPPTASL